VSDLLLQSQRSVTPKVPLNIIISLRLTRMIAAGREFETVMCRLRRCPAASKSTETDSETERSERSEPSHQLQAHQRLRLRKPQTATARPSRSHFVKMILGWTCNSRPTRTEEGLRLKKMGVGRHPQTSMLLRFPTLLELLFIFMQERSCIVSF
jgi:hypothetical protein